MERCTWGSRGCPWLGQALSAAAGPCACAEDASQAGTLGECRGRSLWGGAGVQEPGWAIELCWRKASWRKQHLLLGSC